MTVLVQDHFYSDNLNLHVSSQANIHLWWCFWCSATNGVFLEALPPRLMICDCIAFLNSWCALGKCYTNRRNQGFGSKHTSLKSWDASSLSLNNLRLQHIWFTALTPMIIATISTLLGLHRKLRCLAFIMHAVRLHITSHVLHSESLV